MMNFEKITKEKVIGIALFFALCICISYVLFWFLQTNANKRKIAELENEIYVDIDDGNEIIDYEAEREEQELLLQKNSMDFDKLYSINTDVKGWIKIDALDISYPILQYTDNDYYLSKDIYKEKSISGSIFLDYRNSGFDDKNVVIYGHNMKNDSMFGKLDEMLKRKCSELM